MPKPVADSSRLIGSILILAGTAIGAGMLALPLVSASVGLLPMLLVFLVTVFFAGAALLAIMAAFPASFFIRKRNFTRRLSENRLPCCEDS